MGGQFVNQMLCRECRSTGPERLEDFVHVSVDVRNKRTSSSPSRRTSRASSGIRQPVVLRAVRQEGGRGESAACPAKRSFPTPCWST